MLRSFLYMPANHGRALAKIPDLDVDAVILDLEDAVLPSEKNAARAALAAFMAWPRQGRARFMIRINHPASDDGKADLELLAGCPCDGVMVPKIMTPDDLSPLYQIRPDLPIWAMIEHPAAVMVAPAITAACQGLLLGTSDLAKAMGLYPDDPLRPGLLFALGQCVLAAKAAGIPIIDGVYPYVQDESGLIAQIQQARHLGFDGKSAIHPRQLGPINAGFAISPERIIEARAMIAAFDAAKAQGEGVVLLNGRLIEQLDVDLARADLARSCL